MATSAPLVVGWNDGGARGKAEPAPWGVLKPATRVRKAERGAQGPVPASQAAADSIAGTARRWRPKATGRLRGAGRMRRARDRPRLMSGAGRPMPFAQGLTRKQRGLRRAELESGQRQRPTSECSSLRRCSWWPSNPARSGALRSIAEVRGEYVRASDRSGIVYDGVRDPAEAIGSAMPRERRGCRPKAATTGLVCQGPGGARGIAPDR